jgi:hypothetical protein
MKCVICMIDTWISLDCMWCRFYDKCNRYNKVHHLNKYQYILNKCPHITIKYLNIKIFKAIKMYSAYKNIHKMTIIEYQKWMIHLEQYHVYAYLLIWGTILLWFWMRRTKFPIVRRIPLLTLSLGISVILFTVIIGYGVIYPYQFNCMVITITFNFFASLCYSIGFARAWKLLFLINIQNERKQLHTNKEETWFTDHHHWAQDKYLWRIIAVLFFILSIGWIAILITDDIFTDPSIPSIDSRCTSIVFGVYQTLIETILMIFFSWKLRNADDWLGISYELKLNSLTCLSSIITLIALSFSGASDNDYTWGHLHWMIFSHIISIINVLLPIIQSYKTCTKIKRSKVITKRISEKQKLVQNVPPLPMPSPISIEIKTQDQLNPNRISRNNFINAPSPIRKSQSLDSSPISLKVPSKADGVSITGIEQKEWFRMILSCDLGFNSFKKFLEKEFSDENINFWNEVRQFKASFSNIHILPNDALGSPSVITLLSQAEKIVADYIRSDSPSQVNLPSDIAQQVIKDLSQIQKDHREIIKADSKVENNFQLKLLATIFDRAQSEIFNLMARDSYSRYQEKALYLDIKDKLEKILLGG